MTAQDAVVDYFRRMWVALAIERGMCQAAALIEHQLACEKGYFG